MRRLVQLVGVTVLLLAGASVASSQPSDPQAQRTAIARSLFEEGLAMADRGHWEMAADRFRRAAAIRSSAPILYNLAQSLGRLGVLVEAIEMLHDVEGDGAASAEVRTASIGLRRRLEPRLARLTVAVDGTMGGARVVLDELELPPEAVGVSLPVDPGRHSVKLVGDGGELDHREVELAEGETATAHLVGAGAASDGDAIVEQAWFWAALGVVGASVALGAYIVATSDEPTLPTAAPLLRF